MCSCIVWVFDLRRAIYTYMSIYYIKNNGIKLTIVVFLKEMARSYKIPQIIIYMYIHIHVYIGAIINIYDLFFPLFNRRLSFRMCVYVCICIGKMKITIRRSGGLGWGTAGGN